jgi:transcriptional regulator with XRE-family HTH domain
MEKLSTFAQLLRGDDERAQAALDAVLELKVARSTLSRWRSGKLVPSVPTAAKLRAGLARRGVALPLEAFFPPSSASM